jgi:hypothetical protein
MNRALWMSAVAAILLASVGGTTFLVHFATAQQKKESSREEDVPKLSGQIVQAPETGDAPKAKESHKVEELPKAKESPKVEGSPKGKDDSKPGEARKRIEERRLLVPTVAALASAHCYQTYLNMGFIADGKDKNTYSEKDARKLLDSVLSTVNSLDRSLEALDKFEMEDDERANLEQVRAAWALLRQQGKQLHVVWDGGKDRDEDLKKYESLRRNSWATISKLMGFAR